MKDVIRILFLKNIGNFLDGENFKYIVKKDNDYFIVNDFPIVYNEYINKIITEICYDFDELSMYNQQRYQNYYVELKKVDNNIYSIKDKTYSIKRDLFT